MLEVISLLTVLFAIAFITTGGFGIVLGIAAIVMSIIGFTAAWLKSLKAIDSYLVSVIIVVSLVFINAVVEMFNGGNPVILLFFALVTAVSFIFAGYLAYFIRLELEGQNPRPFWMDPNAPGHEFRPAAPAAVETPPSAQAMGPKSAGARSGNGARSQGSRKKKPRPPPQ